MKNKDLVAILLQNPEEECCYYDGGDLVIANNLFRGKIILRPTIDHKTGDFHPDQYLHQAVYDEAAIAEVQKQVNEYPSRDLKAEYAALCEDGPWFQTFEEFKKMYDADHKCNVEILRRVEEAPHVTVLNSERN